MPKHRKKFILSAIGFTQRLLGLPTLDQVGIGIETEFLPRVFEAFSQADHSVDRSRGGLGLGLALVKGLIELHGGKVHVASGGPGQGSTVSIELPFEQVFTNLTEPVESAGKPSRPCRILVVEDNRVAAKSTELLLTATGHTVQVAYSGREGVEKARRFGPEVVLCDIGLPEMDGYAVANVLRQEFGARIFLIAVSGYGNDEHQWRATEAGFDACVTKPIRFDQLEKMLTALTSGSRVVSASPA